MYWVTALILHIFAQDIVSVSILASSFEIFRSTQSVAVQQNGNLYIIEEKGNMLHSVTGESTIVRSIGGHGVGNYEFDNPTDVSSSFLLDVYVTDFNNRRIQRYDKNLNYVQTFDESTVAPDDGSFQPRAAAVSSQGDLFVVEIDGKRILKLDRRSNLVREFGTFKDGAGAVTEPTDIAVSPSDEVFVLDRSKIISYDLFGNYLRTITLPATEWKNVQASNTALVAVASDRVFIRYFDSGSQTTISRSSLEGLSAGDQFVDGIVHGERLILLTSTSLHFCTITR